MRERVFAVGLCRNQKGTVSRPERDKKTRLANQQVGSKQGLRTWQPTLCGRHAQASIASLSWVFLLFLLYLMYY